MGADAEKPGRPRRPERRRRWLRRLVLVVLLIVLGITLGSAAMHQHVVWSANGNIHTLADVPSRDTVIVLGARIYPDGQPYPMLADRLRTAATLWLDGKGKRILLSGDGSSSPGYDEVTVMRSYILELGVPSDALLEDRAGLRTLDSMYRAHDVFGITSAIVVTNPFHVARSIFLGRQHGMDVIGVAAAHGELYSQATLARNRGREILARVRAWLDVFVLGTQAQVPS